MMTEAKPTRQEPTPDGKRSRRFVITGMLGTVIVALCCFTPLLVGLLAVLGLRALTGYLDFVLLPALVFFICLLAYGLRKQQSGGASCCKDPLSNEGKKDGKEAVRD